MHIKMYKCNPSAHIEKVNITVWMKINELDMCPIDGDKWSPIKN